MSSKLKQKPYRNIAKCTECSYVNTPKHIIRHMRKHTGERPFKCTKCDKTFTQKVCLKRHQPIHTGERPFKCEECDKSFIQRGQLVNHQLIHTDKRPYPCNQCDYAGKSKHYLRTHQRDVHGVGGNKSVKLQCSQCPYSTYQSGPMSTHMLTHTGERPHKCPECGKTFPRKHHLKLHNLTHTGVKAFKCGACDHKATRKGDVQKHERDVHGIDLEKCVKLQCAECSYSTYNTDQFKRHTRTHTGEKPHKCGKCKESFSRTRGLKAHQQKHHPVSK